MPDLLEDVPEKLRGVVSKWTAYAAFGSFLLYLLGYLTLRFQLSTYGVATNLDILDEKYLFAGCRFLVYLVSAVPNILVIILLLVAIGYLPYRLVPPPFRHRLSGWASDWCSKPTRLPLLGVILGVALIQFAMRRCFAFGNLLLRKNLPDEWLKSVILASDVNVALYFSAIVAGTLFTGGILLYVLCRNTATTFVSKLLVGILVFLVAVEFLLLPVNYGVLISTQQLPRVTDVGEAKLATGSQVWLVWDSKDSLTYFVRDPNDQRSLVTVARKDSRVTIVAYDDVLCELFAADHVRSRPCPS